MCYTIQEITKSRKSTTKNKNKNPPKYSSWYTWIQFSNAFSTNILNFLCDISLDNSRAVPPPLSTDIKSFKGIDTFSTRDSIAIPVLCTSKQRKIPVIQMVKMANEQLPKGYSSRSFQDNISLFYRSIAHITGMCILFEFWFAVELWHLFCRILPSSE